MSLKKTIVTDTGYEGDYIKLVSGYDENDRFCNLLVWKNQEAKDSGKTHLPYGLTIPLPVGLITEDKLKVEGKTPRVLVYEYIKTLPLLLGSTDI